MKTRIISAVIALPIFLFILLFAPLYILAFTISIICSLMAYELLLAILPVKGNIRLFIYTVISAFIVPVGSYFNISSFLFYFTLLTLMILVFIEAIMRYHTERQLPMMFILGALFGGLMIPYLLATLLNLRLMEHGKLLVLIPVICAFATDAGAYFTGVLLGKNKIFPRVSPNKTIEGCIGGVVIGTLFLMLYGVAIINLTSITYVNFMALLIYGMIGSVICQIGDLTFSLIKREFKVKDFGQLLPGHGGMLDRFDSMVFTAPAMYLLVMTLPMFQEIFIFEVFHVY